MILMSLIDLFLEYLKPLQDYVLVFHPIFQRILFFLLVEILQHRYMAFDAVLSSKIADPLLVLREPVPLYEVPSQPLLVVMDPLHAFKYSRKTKSDRDFQYETISLYSRDARERPTRAQAGERGFHPQQQERCRIPSPAVDYLVILVLRRLMRSQYWKRERRV